MQDYGRLQRKVRGGIARAKIPILSVQTRCPLLGRLPTVRFHLKSSDSCLSAFGEMRKPVECLLLGWEADSLLFEIGLRKRTSVGST